jgi:cbb3-type cytochrome oxidase subunit 1
MSESTRSATWLRLAVVYFVVAVAIGIVMGASGDHSLMPVHAHLNLLGWVSMTLFGLIGHLFPATMQGRIATLQFWLYNLSVPILLATLAALLRGHKELEPVVGIGSVVTGIAVLLFAYQLLAKVKAPATA